MRVDEEAGDPDDGDDDDDDGILEVEIGNRSNLGESGGEVGGVAEGEIVGEPTGEVGGDVPKSVRVGGAGADRKKLVEVGIGGMLGCSLSISSVEWTGRLCVVARSRALLNIEA